MLPVFPHELANNNESDPHYNNVVLHIPGEGIITNGCTLLLHFEGGHTSTQILDSGPNQFVVNRAGDTSLSTTTMPYGTSSCYFDGASDYLFYSNNVAWQFGAGDFTIEFWVRFNVIPGSGQYQNLIAHRTSPTNSFSYIIYATNGSIYAGFSTSGTAQTGSCNSPATLVANTWYHVAIVRYDGYIACYLDGVRNGLGYNIGTGSLYSSGDYLRIGVGDGTGNPFAGYIKDIRITKSPLYTENFIRPTQLLSALGNEWYDPYWYDTKVLVTGDPVHGNTYVYDKGSLNRDMTLVGNPKISTALAPYGAWEFDGNGDYLNIPGGGYYNISTSDFTVEAWIYLYGPSPSVDGNGNRQTYVIRSDDDKFHLLEIQGNATDTGTGFGVWNGTTWQGATYTFSYNQWYHIAISKRNAIARYYVNGTKISEQANSISYGDTSLGIHIGGTNIATWNRYFYGQIRELRLTTGISRYFEDSFEPLGRIPNSRANLIPEIIGNLIRVYGVGVRRNTKPFGVSSLWFPGTSNNTLRSINPVTLGTSWTVDFYVRAENFTSGPYLVGMLNAFTSPTSRWGLQFTAAGLLQFYHSVNNNYTYSNFTAVAGRWYKIALQNNNGRVQIFVDGRMVADEVPANAVPNITGYFEIGSAYFNSSNNLSGYMKDIRITKNIARYKQDNPHTSEFKAFPIRRGNV